MKVFPILLLSFIFSCSGLKSDGPREDVKIRYSYTDVTGSYSYNRETKFLKNKLVTRSQLIDVKSMKTVEKNVTMSQVGTIKNKKSRILTVRPLASEFTVWLEGKKYSSKMQLNPKTKSMTVKLESPEPKWKGTTEIPFPKAKYFCFYSQIPDCLYHNRFLSLAQENPKREFSFYVVWDSFPYVQEQFTNVGKNLFAQASVKFEGDLKKTLRYVVELEGQVILYHFSKSYELVKMAWIAQGITVVPPGEEIPNEEQ